MRRSTRSWLQRHISGPLDRMYVRLDRDAEAASPEPTGAASPEPTGPASPEPTGTGAPVDRAGLYEAIA